MLLECSPRVECAASSYCVDGMCRVGGARTYVCTYVVLEYPVLLKCGTYVCTIMCDLGTDWW